MWKQHKALCPGHTRAMAMGPKGHGARAMRPRPRHWGLLGGVRKGRNLRHAFDVNVFIFNAFVVADLRVLGRANK